jgi:flagellar hook capping protein FlgD
MESTALDLGPPDKDNDYGAGRIRAPEALAATPSPAGPAMQLVSQAIHDTIPPADGDGRLEPGETADVEITLLNAGPYLLGDVVGALQDDSPHLSISDNVAAFGDIPPAQQRDNAGNLCRVVVSPGAPPGAVVTFTLALSAYGACGAVTFKDTLQNPLVAVEPGGSGPLPPLALREVTPNPAGSAAWLEFTMAAAGHVRLALYDVRGRRVRTLVDEARAAGVHREPWDGRDDRGMREGAGIYLARVEAAGLRAQRKFVWLGR